MVVSVVAVVLVDDHPLARAGVRRMLETSNDIEVVAEAATTDEALLEIASRDVHVVLLDISLPGEGGMNLLCRLRRTRPEIAVLMLSSHPEEKYAIRAVMSGAAGYLTKDVSIADLVSAVHKAARGVRHLSAWLSERLVLQLQGDTLSNEDKLSRREFEVMLRIANGESVTCISQAMFLSPKTISTYRRRVLDKLNIDNNAGLTRFAMETGLIPAQNRLIP
jgi:DNA-binding NarL/FixJ family response regulator